jgi:hypothetical protein
MSGRGNTPNNPDAPSTPNVPTPQEKEVRKKYRHALLYISNHLVKKLLPGGVSFEKAAEGFPLPGQHDVLRRALGFPDSVKIIRVSPHYRFASNQLALVLASDLFIESEEAMPMPEVDAFYEMPAGGGKPTFLHFGGPAMRKD